MAIKPLGVNEIDHSWKVGIVKTRTELWRKEHTRTQEKEDTVKETEEEKIKVRENRKVDTKENKQASISMALHGEI